MAVSAVPPGERGGGNEKFYAGVSKRFLCGTAPLDRSGQRCGDLGVFGGLFNVLTVPGGLEFEELRVMAAGG